MSGQFALAKRAFVDEVNVEEYIELEGSRRAFAALNHSLEKSTKMVLLYGEPGTGKTLLLNRLYEANKDKHEIYLLDTPARTRVDLYKRLFEIFTGTPFPEGSSILFETFVEFGRKIKGERNVVILLDEAQMYPTEILEEIRILSDTGSIKFIIALHKTTDEDVVVKKHFQSRIWETIHLANATEEELQAYVQKRLLHAGLDDWAQKVGKKEARFIHRHTGGNFRECNKLMYTLFEIYEYYDRHDAGKIDYGKLSRKFLEMAAIKTGLIDV
ncbi:AAA family ATPase [Nitratifractor sp.]